MAGPARDMFRDVRSTIDAVRESISAPSSPAARPRPTTNAEIEEVIRAFVSALPGAYRIVVPGQHSGGISHQELLGVLAKQGRDFLQSTVQLIQAVRAALRREFLGTGALPAKTRLQKVAGLAILEHVERRFEKGNGDIRVEALSPRYRAFKVKSGRGAQPIGVFTGELRAQYSRKAKIEWLR